nr:type II toxin-antitoxin system RelE/ParE family toxin [Actinobacillus porcinus]
MLIAKSVQFSPLALNNLNEIIENVIAFTGYELSGIKLSEAIFNKIESISYLPSAIGRKRDDNTREAFVRGYRIVYEEKEDYIWIITIIHSSRLYPRS